MPHLKKRMGILKNRVRELRNQEGLTQTELGKMIGVSYQTIQSIECGRYEPTAYTAGLIAAALGKPFEEVFWIGMEDAHIDKERRNK